jgi:hypothetical protein
MKIPNVIRAGKAGSGVRRVSGTKGLFRPTNPRPVVDYHRAVCAMSGENATERKDRIVG